MEKNEKLISKCKLAGEAGKVLSSSEAKLRNKAIERMSQILLENSASILDANDTDIENAKKNGIKESMIDRLKLTEQRLYAISQSLMKVAVLPDPLGGGDVWTRPNGLEIKRVHVPIGHIAIIYEARPNVTADAAALCIKSGNTVILRGGSEAINSNKAMVRYLRQALSDIGLSEECIQIVDDCSRETATELMKLNGYVDLLIPRGSASLIKSVVSNATVPVVETGAGNCHVYVEKTADLKMAAEIVFNAKMQRPSVCNAAENLLVDESIAKKFLPMIKKKLEKAELRGDKKTREILPDIKEATEEDFYTEYNDYIMSLKIVKDYKEAVDHINKHNTGHSEAIVTKNVEAAYYFTKNIDAAAVYVNASTRFTDGEEFGFGAEIGISTQKLHARGPMGLNELTTIKYIVNGSGQVRK